MTTEYTVTVTGPDGASLTYQVPVSHFAAASPQKRAALALAIAGQDAATRTGR